MSAAEFCKLEAGSNFHFPSNHTPRSADVARRKSLQAKCQIIFKMVFKVSADTAMTKHYAAICSCMLRTTTRLYVNVGVYGHDGSAVAPTARLIYLVIPGHFFLLTAVKLPAYRWAFKKLRSEERERER